MMENHEGKGGSYVRNPDGTLSLAERTIRAEEAAAIASPAESPANPDPQAAAPAGSRKKNTDKE